MEHVSNANAPLYGQRSMGSQNQGPLILSPLHSISLSSSIETGESIKHWLRRSSCNSLRLEVPQCTPPRRPIRRSRLPRPCARRPRKRLAPHRVPADRRAPSPGPRGPRPRRSGHSDGKDGRHAGPLVAQAPRGRVEASN